LPQDGGTFFKISKLLFILQSLIITFCICLFTQLSLAFATANPISQPLGIDILHSVDSHCIIFDNLNSNNNNNNNKNIHCTMSSESKAPYEFPSIYVSHGGGPMPLLGQQPVVANAFKRLLPDLLKRNGNILPKAIVLITAHWQSTPISISSGTNPSLYYDYGGFPPEAYKLSYPAPGHPDLANKIQSLFKSHGVSSKLDSKRGWDHGTFIPMMLINPSADIPIVQVGVSDDLDTDLHIRMGEALRPLRKEGVLIIGSGSSFHNFAYFFAQSSSQRNEGIAYSKQFNDWLTDTLCSKDHSAESRRAKMVNIRKETPSTSKCHPPGKEEHLIPLHVCFGAGGSGAKPAVAMPEGHDKSAGGGGGLDLAVFSMSNFMWE
jgi:aromatic ring-opening dioxygenase catalytic subunit (LigB family)